MGWTQIYSAYAHSGAQAKGAAAVQGRFPMVIEKAQEGNPGHSSAGQPHPLQSYWPQSQAQRQGVGNIHYL